MGTARGCGEQPRALPVSIVTCNSCTHRIYHQGLGGCIAIHADGQHSLGVAKALAEARIQRNGPHLVHADGVLAGALDRQLYLHVWRQVSRGIIFGTDVESSRCLALPSPASHLARA